MFTESPLSNRSVCHNIYIFHKHMWQKMRAKLLQIVDRSPFWEWNPTHLCLCLFYCFRVDSSCLTLYTVDPTKPPSSVFSFCDPKETFIYLPIQIVFPRWNTHMLRVNHQSVIQCHIGWATDHGVKQTATVENGLRKITRISIKIVIVLTDFWTRHFPYKRRVTHLSQLSQWHCIICRVYLVSRQWIIINGELEEIR
jgi:hypothetical protein